MPSHPFNAISAARSYTLLDSDNIAAHCEDVYYIADFMHDSITVKWPFS